MSASETPDFFELGDKTSLVCCDPGTVGAAQTALRDLGFKVHTAETAEHAVDRMHYTSYDCIIVHEHFGGSLTSNPVLHYLKPLPMAQRRHWFVCLIGPSCTTLDAMQAFGQSVHCVVNPDDLPKLGPILKKGLAEFELLYRVHTELHRDLR